MDADRTPSFSCSAVWRPRVNLKQPSGKTKDLPSKYDAEDGRCTASGRRCLTSLGLCGLFWIRDIREYQSVRNCSGRGEPSNRR